MIRPLLFILLLQLTGCNASDHEAIVSDDSSRVISLAPHITELVFTAGAGDSLVGVVEYSDYPEAAKSITRVGDAFQLDLEGIIALKPDVVFAWGSGNPQHSLSRLKQLGLRVVVLEPISFESIANELRLIGEITNHRAEANKAATQFLRGLASLRDKYAKADPVRVFYQISQQPIFTINGNHVISEAITVCGGVNIFNELEILAPSVDLEAVLVRDPEVIIYGTSFEAQARARWLALQDLAANKLAGLYSVPGDLLSRASTRMLRGVHQMCGMIQRVRETRADLAEG